MKNSNLIIFQKQLIVQPEHLDQLKHVNNVQYLYWVQEIASEHWYSQFPNSTIEEEYWVALEHHIQYKKPAFLEDQLILKTFVEAPIGIRFPRKVHVYRETELLVEARTIWCLVNAISNRPRRISSEILSAFGL